MTTLVEPLAAVADITVVAHGTPAAQGSKRHVGGGRLIEQSAAVAPWRETVKWAARVAMREALRDQPLEGPLRVVVTFTVVKPGSAPKRRRTWPAKRPDLDKMLRACFDAITDAGVWVDDGQVVEVVGRKAYPGEHDDALTSPGAVIRIWAVGDGAPC